MRIKTGETATARLTVDILYRCSSCGRENLTTDTVSGQGHTATVMGVNLNRDMYSDARQSLPVILPHSKERHIQFYAGK